MASLRLICDSCEKEFDLDSVGIISTSINLDEGLCEVDFFYCPSCRRIHLVAVRDARWLELKEDLDNQSARLRRAIKRDAKDLMKTITGMVQVKKDRLGRHTERLKKKYEGRFTLVTTENGTEDLELLP